MKSHTIAFLFFCWIVTCSTRAWSFESGVVEKVVDGDTVKVTLVSGHASMTLSVLGIECPEKKKNYKCKQDEKAGRKGCDWQIPHGMRAAEKAAEMLNKQPVKLECGKECKLGGFNRPLRYIRMKDERDFGLEMIRLGLCREASWKIKHQRMNAYQKAQNKAKAMRLGIWDD